jgi:HSP20 family molecular chaperone IbpA
VQVGPLAFRTREEVDRQLTVICKGKAELIDGGGPYFSSKVAARLVERFGQRVEARWLRRNHLEHLIQTSRSMGGVLAPRMDVAADERTVTPTAGLPGVKESDIDVSLVGDQLTIKGEKRSEHEEKKEVEGRTLHRVERSYGAFQRTLTVRRYMA